MYIYTYKTIYGIPIIESWNDLGGKDTRTHPAPPPGQGHLPLDEDAPSPVQARNPFLLTAVSSIRAQSDELDVLKNLLLNVKIRKKKKSKKEKHFSLSDLRLSSEIPCAVYHPEP